MRKRLYSDLHGHYQAHKITLAGLDDEAFARSLTSARVQMNPHQVEAALTAAVSAGDLDLLERLIGVLAAPYDAAAPAEFTSPPPPDSGPYRTFCGT